MIPAAQWRPQEVSEPAHARLHSGGNSPSDRMQVQQLQVPQPQTMQAVNHAPNLNSTTTGKPNPQSCQFCRKRKIKCDKLEGGCSQCARAQTECIYPASQRKGRPRKAGTSRPVPAPTPREAQLLKKIVTLERQISVLNGKDPGSGPGEVDGLVPDVDELSREQLGRLVIGKPYVNDSFWSEKLMDVLHEAGEEDSMDDEDDDSLGPNTASDVFPAQYLFGATQHNGHLSQAHPPAPHVMIYWNLYIENCECLLRLLHVPSVAKIMAQTQMDPTALTRGQEALVSAIYYAAVTSTPAEEVLGHFGVDRHSLIARYEAAVQQALVNASFLNTQDLTVLQAFVLYLVCTRHNDGASVWSMTGLAIRIAQGMGIDRDGELFKLSPLEVELRRRVWHQISLLDLRSSEARGAKPMHLVYDTKTPLNINDADIGPETLVMPAARVGYTDATVALLRLEVCDMTRKLYRTQGVAGKQKLIEDFEQHMELDYLRYCGAGPPLQRMCMNLGRLVVKRMILMIVKREADLPMPVREKLFNIAVDIVDLSNQLRRDEYARRWSWLVKTYMQWHAMAFILSELSEQPISSRTDRAWKVIEETGPVSDWKVPDDKASRILYQSVKKLLSKAVAHRDSQLMPLKPEGKDKQRETGSSPNNHMLQTSTQPSFVPNLLADQFHNAHTHHGFMTGLPTHQGIQHQGLPQQQFYIPQQIGQEDMLGHAHGHVQPWFYDPNTVLPLHSDHDLVFHPEYWSGLDPVKDYTLHGGPA